MLSVNYGVNTGAVSLKKQEDSRKSWASTVLNGVREVGRWAINHPGLVIAFVSAVIPTLARAEDVINQQLGVCPAEPVTNSECVSEPQVLQNQTAILHSNLVDCFAEPDSSIQLQIPTMPIPMPTSVPPTMPPTMPPTPSPTPTLPSTPTPPTSSPTPVPTMQPTSEPTTNWTLVESDAPTSSMPTFDDSISDAT